MSIEREGGKFSSGKGPEAGTLPSDMRDRKAYTELIQFLAKYFSHSELKVALWKSGVLRPGNTPVNAKNLEEFAREALGGFINDLAKLESFLQVVYDERPNAQNELKDILRKLATNN